MQHIFQDRRPSLPVILIALAFSAFFTPARADVAEPGLDLREVADAEVAEALRAGYSLPELLRSHPSQAQAGEWAAAIETDRRRLAEIMRYFGYLDGEVGFKSDFKKSQVEDEEASDYQDEVRQPDTVQLTPVPGPLYRIGIIELDGIEGRGVEPRIVRDLASLLAPIPGSVARSDIISRLEDEILFRVTAGPYPLASVTSRSMVPNRETLTATVRLVIDIGSPVRFGSVTFRGLKRLDPQTLMNYVPFYPGDPFDRNQLAALRNKLEKLDLFSSVRVGYADAPDESGLVPIQVTLRENPPDTKQLARSGFTGLIVTAVALSLLALRQVAVAGASSRRMKRSLDLVLFLLILTTIALAGLRVLNFLQGL